MNAEPSDQAVQLSIGPFRLWDAGPDKVGIMLVTTGEGGTFPKEELAAYLHAFFGLNF
jgi:hypothetical protein